MITERTTLLDLERIAREHHVQSIMLERPPNGRSGVAARLERSDRVVVVRTGATIADAIGLALAEMISRPRRDPPCDAPPRLDPYAKSRCPSCRNVDPNILGSGPEPCSDVWHDVERARRYAGIKS